MSIRSAGSPAADKLSRSDVAFNVFILIFFPVLVLLTLLVWAGVL